jgi:multidrug efflux pump subunit AcrA (membrane-fusion protein)
MDDQEARLAELESKTQQNNYDFVHAELDACLSLVQNGMREFELQNYDTARLEAQKAEEGYKMVIASVAALRDEQERAEVEKRWTDLRTQLDALQSLFKDSD